MDAILQWFACHVRDPGSLGTVQKLCQCEAAPEAGALPFLSSGLALLFLGVSDT